MISDMIYTWLANEKAKAKARLVTATNMRKGLAKTTMCNVSKQLYKDAQIMEEFAREQMKHVDDFARRKFNHGKSLLRKSDDSPRIPHDYSVSPYDPPAQENQERWVYPAKTGIGRTRATK